MTLLGGSRVKRPGRMDNLMRPKGVWSKNSIDDQKTVMIRPF
jgi:hypothetical protein